MLKNVMTMNMTNLGTKKCRHEWWHRDDSVSRLVTNLSMDEPCGMTGQIQMKRSKKPHM